MGKEVVIDGRCYLILNWNKVSALIDSLANKIEARPYKPSLIIGIFRGGMTVAHLLSDRLGVYNIRGIGARVYQRIGAIGEKLEIYQPLPLEELRDYDVLIVEDVVDTGTTYKGILEEEIRHKNPRSLCTASLHVKPLAKYRPDIYVEETTCWVCYPWESCEVGRDMYRELLKKHDLETTRKILVEKFEIEPNIVERITESTSAKKPR
ncbi:MAG: phosphoribosyltransferase family protein [Candidatus Bathyarchaeota archaeon]